MDNQKSNEKNFEIIMITSKYAIWGISPNSVEIIKKICLNYQNVDIFISHRLKDKFFTDKSYEVFEKLSSKVVQNFNKYSGHFFIMSTGIVVRIIAPLLKHKTVDPAVIVIDDASNFVISLISGHLGGANKLAAQLAQILDAQAVITTATDVNKLPSIDLIAKEHGLQIENSDMIKKINMCFIENKKFILNDPYGIFANNQILMPFIDNEDNADYKIYIGEKIKKLEKNSLFLRPKNLVIGIGCNRNTLCDEIYSFLCQILEKNFLSMKSIKNLASIDLKNDEKGLLELAKKIDVSIDFYGKDQLEKVKNINNPSEIVKKHVGVKSVCEAAAILSAKTKQLIIPKQKTKNVTIAIARTNFM